MSDQDESINEMVAVVAAAQLPAPPQQQPPLYIEMIPLPLGVVGVIPQPFNTFNSYQSVSTYFADRSLIVHTNMTNYAAFVNTSTAVDSYVRETGHLTDPQEISAVGSRMLSDTLRRAGPILAQVWLLSKPAMYSIHKFFNSLNANVEVLANHYDQFLPSVIIPVDPELLEVYNRALIDFRTMLSDFSCPGSEVLTNITPLSLSVGDVNLIALIDILKRMVNQRNTRLGARGVGAQHLDELREWWSTSPDLNDLVTLTYTEKRRATVDNCGYEMVNGIATLNPKLNAHLLSTALSADRQQGGQIADKIFAHQFDGSTYGRHNNDLFQMVKKEMAMMEVNQASPFNHQKSNIDSMFLTHFVVFRILHLSLADAYRFGKGMYTVGRKVRGKKDTLKALIACSGMPGVRDLISKISSSTDIHLPPWVMNYPRIQDMVAVIGFIDPTSFPTIYCPSVSWRYLSNLTRNNSNALNVIVAMNSIEKDSHKASKIEPDSAIFQSEHMLHQFILLKTSPLQNSNQVKGNALAVKFVA